jgi:haloacetate dehalogenase
MSNGSDLFPGFKSGYFDTEEGSVFVRHGGEGPPVLLLHGFPQTHACWHRIAPELDKSHHVVCMDLRGYAAGTFVVNLGMNGTGFSSKFVR